MGKGKLVFKGETKPKKKKKKSKHSISIGGTKSSSEALDSTVTDAKKIILSSADAASHSNVSATTSETTLSTGIETPRIQKGQGRITSSAAVLTGHDTKFSKLRAGDAVLVQIPISKSESRQEMRVLTMILSNTSASISTPFSVDLKIPTSFSFVSKPRNYEEEARRRLKKEKELKEETERCAFGTYKSNEGNNELVYREKTEHGGYRIRKETLHENVSRGGLLDMRSKRKSDRYC